MFPWHLFSISFLYSPSLSPSSNLVRLTEPNCLYFSYISLSHFHRPLPSSGNPARRITSKSLKRWSLLCFFSQNLLMCRYFPLSASFEILNTVEELVLRSLRILYCDIPSERRRTIRSRFARIRYSVGERSSARNFSPPVRVSRDTILRTKCV